MSENRYPDFKIFYYASTSRIAEVCWIVFRVDVLVQRAWINDPPCVRVHGLEPARQRVVPASPQVVEVEIRVEPLATVAEVVGRRAGGRYRHAEGIVSVRVGDRPSGVRQEPHVAVAIVAVETRRPRATHKLVLADVLQAVGVRARHRATDQFIEHLCVPSRIQIVHQILCRRGSYGF